MVSANDSPLERLFTLAKGHTGQSQIARNFLLAWYNGRAHGGFDLSDLFCVDKQIAEDMLTVFAHLARRGTAAYPNAFGYGDAIQKLAAMRLKGDG
jgi:hypothetical protein